MGNQPRSSRVILVLAVVGIISLGLQLKAIGRDLSIPIRNQIPTNTTLKAQQGRVVLDDDFNEDRTETCGVIQDHQPHPIPRLLSSEEKRADAVFLQTQGGPGKTVEIRVHAVVVSDDDGTNLTPMTEAQVQTMLNNANQIYEPDVGLRFVLVAYSTIKNTVINNLSLTQTNEQVACDEDYAPAGSRNKTQQAAFEEAAKAPYAGELVVFFHNFQWQRDAAGNCVRGGVTAYFSGSLLNFVAMGGVSPGSNFGPSKFAHEAGHFFGLVHTFWGNYTDVNSALDRINSFAAANPNQPPQQALDGDLSYTSSAGIDYAIADTAADPSNTLYALYWTRALPPNSTVACQVGNGLMSLSPPKSGPANLVDPDSIFRYFFTPPRSNAMSYFMSCPYISGNTVGTPRAYLTLGQKEAIWRTIRLDPSRRRLLYFLPNGPMEAEGNTGAF